MCAVPFYAYGDAMVVTQAMNASTVAEVYIEKDWVRVEFEIGMSDIPSFKNILPDAIYADMGYGAEPLVDRLNRFFREDLVLAADGHILSGRIGQIGPRKRIKRDEITGEPLANQGEAEDVLFVEFLFPLNDGSEGEGAFLPTKLTLTPPLNERGASSATIGLMVYHMGVPVMDFRYLGRAETLHLDWEDPWYSQFENRNLHRQYNEPISVFLYAEPFETRVEVIVRPKDIQQWHDLGIDGMDTIPVAMQPQLKEQIAQFLLAEMEVQVDGAVVVPELQRINFLERTLKSSIVIDPPEELAANSATLGVIYSVPTETLPQEAQVTWNLFSPKMQLVRAACTDEAGPLPSTLRPDDNVLVWKNFLKHPTIPTIREITVPIATRSLGIPLASVFCLLLVFPVRQRLKRSNRRGAALVSVVVLLAAAGGLTPFMRASIALPVAAELSEDDSQALVSGLLANVYTAFDFRDESTIYDALDQSLQGDLLTEVYLQTMQSLELESQGGARVKVKGVELNEVNCEPTESGIRAVCNWDVKGSVGHWGHLHQRVNRYDAELIIEPVDGEWKIVALEILEEQRIQ